MKQDSIFLKKILDSKTNELAKTKKTLEEVQIENSKLTLEIEELRKGMGNDKEFK